MSWIREIEIPSFYISGGSHLKKWWPFFETGSHFEFRNVKFPSLTRKPLERCNYTIVCDVVKGNSAILHIRGSHLKNGGHFEKIGSYF